MNIQKLINKNCGLCNSPLTAILMDHLTSPHIPFVNSQLNNDEFIFKLYHVSPTIYINQNCSINIISNKLQFKDEITFHQLVDVMQIFEKMSIYLKLQCTNNACQHDYFLSSSLMKSIPPSAICLHTSATLLGERPILGLMIPPMRGRPVTPSFFRMPSMP